MGAAKKIVCVKKFICSAVLHAGILQPGFNVAVQAHQSVLHRQMARQNEIGPGTRSVTRQAASRQQRFAQWSGTW